MEYTTTSTDSNGNTHTNRHYAYSKRDIIRAVIPLTVAGSNVHAGSYEIPFQYKLPDDLPGSFYHSYRGGHCSVRYKIKLQFKGNASKELLLQIRSKPYAGPPLPHLVQPVTSPVSICCCIPTGSVTVAANGKQEDDLLSWVLFRHTTSTVCSKVYDLRVACGCWSSAWFTR